MNLLRRGSPSAPLLLAFHCGPSLAPACPESWSVVSAIGEDYPHVGSRHLAVARGMSGAQGPLVLAGWSAGCQAVRALLRAGVDVAAALVLDGAAGNWPHVEPWQVETWREFAATGKPLVITATEQVYTEHLDVRPYASTLRIASAVWLGWDIDATRLAEREEMLAPGAYERGSLRIEAHASATIDGNAHTREATEHGPRLMRDTISHAFDADAGPLTQRAPVTQAPPTPRTAGDGGRGMAESSRPLPSHQSYRRGEGLDVSQGAPSPLSLGLRALELARAALAAGVREDPKRPNRGDEVDRYLRGCVRGGKRLGVLGVPWCAAFASWCVWVADGGPDAPDPLAVPIAFLDGAGWREPGRWVRSPPIGYRAAVSELIADARATGAWREMTAAETPMPGDLVCMRRNGHDPRTGGEGHVEIVDEVTADGLWCIGGNVQDRVARTLRHMNDLVGWIRIR